MRQSIRKQEADQESMEKQRKKVCVMTCIEPLASIVAQVYNVCKEIGWIGGALMSGRVYCAHIAEDTNGKPVRIQTCTEHARGTASLAAEMLADQGLFNSGYSAGLLHDCGKFTDEFSTYLSKAAVGETVKKGSVVHTFAGVRYLLENFHSDDTVKADDLPSEILAAAIASHHGLIDIWDQRMN